ncbi:DUF3108 domain-containing protein [Kiritimatiellaeota bacterium B1221]|nr:DUF3108 domain-containing protein [Kiritimatiellaeota bacterium B1221]
MKNIFLILMLCWGAALLSAEEDTEDLPPVPEVQLPFPMGETLSYSIYWGIIGVGESKATTSWVWQDDQWLIRVRFRTQSNGVLAKLYPVDDVVDTFIDPVTLRPVLHVLDLQEGKHERHSQTIFDWSKMQAVYTKAHEDKEDEVKIIPLEENSRDLVSFMYFLRDASFEENKLYEFEVLSDYKMYDLTVETAGIDKIHLSDYGKVKSLKLIPEAKFDGVFVSDGKIELWLSNDVRRLLTKLELDTPFANVKLLLKSVEGPGAKDWEKK